MLEAFMNFIYDVILNNDLKKTLRIVLQKMNQYEIW